MRPLYSNRYNVLGEILLSRYDLFASSGLKSYLATKLTSMEIEHVYSLRGRSRRREMFLTW
ncbi:hypothetical protein PKOR_15800 [Pontibacter korlensis]|uniref:Uncharacterized protein n=1 Tax=Pontibacter korlensis TaxID=400092 RepID=A0A0E3ZGP5_9BACT|nr:hypothetical protein [Pontibacter korlensis]AKD04283.1 hypothetical protein PKOR_15800 [Pontibacter korlensis]